MQLRELITFKSVFFSLIALSGFSYGLYDQINAPPLDPIKIALTKEEFAHMLLPEIKSDGSVLEGLSVATFTGDYRSSRLTAKTIRRDEDGTIRLIKPAYYEYDTDGKTIIAKSSGDHGIVIVEIKAKSFKDIRIWGNLKVRRAPLGGSLEDEIDE